MTQYTTESCADCGEPSTVTPDPFANGSPYEFAITCTVNLHHAFIRSYAHINTAPTFTERPQRHAHQRQPRTPRAPAPPLTQAQQSLYALLTRS